MKGRIRSSMLVLFATCVAAPPAAFAQAYPAKPIRFVVAYPPGGATDLVARAIAPKMSEALGQPVIIENNGGAAGRIAAQQMARATPDGYTIVLMVTGSHLLRSHLEKYLPFDPVKDFTPITQLVETVLASSDAMKGCSVRTTARPARRSTPPRRSLRALEPVSTKRRRSFDSRRACTTFKSSGTRCTSSRTTVERSGAPRTMSPSRSGHAVNSRATSGWRRSMTSASGNTRRSHVELARPAGPEQEETLPGRGQESSL